MSTPQDAPVHPAPWSVHEIRVLGFEPGTGVSVAVTAAVRPVVRFPGADSVSEKLLVMVTVAEACFDGSATLCAVTVSVGALGRIRGAVNLPLASTKPHGDAQLAPETFHRTAVSGWPLLVMLGWKICVAPSSTLLVVGLSEMAMSLTIVMLALADLLGSA